MPTVQQQAKDFSLVIDNGSMASRRDDLEAWFYSIGYFVPGFIPWRDDVSSDDIRRKKEGYLQSPEFEKLPNAFHEIFNYIKSLGFKDEPDYTYIRNRLIRMAVEENIVLDNTYDWSDKIPAVAPWKDAGKIYVLAGSEEERERIWGTVERWKKHFRDLTLVRGPADLAQAFREDGPYAGLIGFGNGKKQLSERTHQHESSEHCCITGAVTVTDFLINARANEIPFPCFTILQPVDAQLSVVTPPLEISAGVIVGKEQTAKESSAASQFTKSPLFVTDDRYVLHPLPLHIRLDAFAFTKSTGASHRPLDHRAGGGGRSALLKGSGVTGGVGSGGAAGGLLIGVTVAVVRYLVGRLNRGSVWEFRRKAERCGVGLVLSIADAIISGLAEGDERGRGFDMVVRALRKGDRNVGVVGLCRRHLDLVARNLEWEASLENGSTAAARTGATTVGGHVSLEGSEVIDKKKEKGTVGKDAPAMNVPSLSSSTRCIPSGSTSPDRHPTCHKSHPKLSSLRDHARTHELHRMRNCQSMLCHERFLRRQDFRRHDATHLEGVKPWKCEGCGTRFTRRDASQRHRKARRCGALSGVGAEVKVENDNGFDAPPTPEAMKEMKTPPRKTPAKRLGFETPEGVEKKERTPTRSNSRLRARSGGRRRLGGNVSVAVGGGGGGGETSAPAVGSTVVTGFERSDTVEAEVVEGLGGWVGECSSEG
ncbi:hypothetical protein HDV00_012355 [Rhizophlyctis rosea]|nr:hypothetical protein HDV00_012355 [Rhizophlyctis rosea]